MMRRGRCEDDAGLKPDWLLVCLFNMPMSVRLPPDLNARPTAASLHPAWMPLITDGKRDLGIIY